ncbi:hypothetical protein HanRHA438_Chr04g0188281 [Helianthus annuus]|nr:hypothetical protein HanIR_Chr04g0192371 [Helianthus annuus]KAJ0927915.1 hypothetical protein HanRHA438_Chr04g0188281 [Helianthus annuus]
MPFMFTGVGLAMVGGCDGDYWWRWWDGYGGWLWMVKVGLWWWRWC